MINPFIPLRKANICIVDGRVDKKIVNNLEKLNIKVIRTLECKDIRKSISYHPDIVIHPITHNSIIVAPNVFDYYDEQLSGRGINVIKGESQLDIKYPDDIAYNVARLKGVAIHNFKHTDEKLKFYLEKQNLEFVNVKQGYSKCSLAILDNTSGITADIPMYQKLTSLGFDILLIEPGYIILQDERYGFIGGASGNYSEDTIFFSGFLCNHPDLKKIESFIDSKNKKIIYLSNEEVIDFGTIINLNSNC